VEEVDYRQLSRGFGFEHNLSVAYKLCRGVRKLNLAHESGGKHIPLSGARLEQVLRRMRMVEEVSLLGRGSPDLVKALCAASPTLHTVNLAFSKRLTDDHLKPMLEGCPNLRSLHLPKLQRVTDATVKRIVQCCPHMETLNLSFSGAALELLGNPAGGCAGLLSLWVRNASGEILDGHLAVLARGCPRLRSLRVDHNRGITGAGLEEVARRCTDLTELWAERTKGSQATLRALLDLRSFSALGRLPAHGGRVNLRPAPEEPVPVRGIGAEHHHGAHPPAGGAELPPAGVPPVRQGGGTTSQFIRVRVQPPVAEHVRAALSEL